MIIRTNEMTCKDKDILEGTSKKTGNEYTMYRIYLKGEDGLLYQIVTNKTIYDRAEKEKRYKLVIEIPTNGKIAINDIELLNK